MNEIKFAEWLAENHFILYNVVNKTYYWISESYSNEPLSSEYLFNKFLYDTTVS
jgi:hypothetical protein